MKCPVCKNKIPFKTAWKLGKIKVFPCPSCQARLASSNFKTFNTASGIIGIGVTYVTLTKFGYLHFSIAFVILLLIWFFIVPFFLKYENVSKKVS